LRLGNGWILSGHGRFVIVRDDASASNFTPLEKSSCLVFESSILFSVHAYGKTTIHD
jgi:hypothetical protein